MPLSPTGASTTGAWEPRAPTAAVYITNGKTPSMLHLTDCPHQVTPSEFREATEQEQKTLRWCHHRAKRSRPGGRGRQVIAGRLNVGGVALEFLEGIAEQARLADEHRLAEEARRAERPIKGLSRGAGPVGSFPAGGLIARISSMLRSD